MQTNFGEFSVVFLHQVHEDLDGPIRDVATVAQIRERSLRCASFVFESAQFVGQLDQKLSIALSLALWEYQDARQVVLNFGSDLF